ncbi:DUF3088 family protein [Phenylobacterium sp. LjRoot225]|uniref:DUF3088 family protein n=1 Tax=Phenylobacterium sp. LjRoot225 TaxID=3342285 RepID=UPI003ECFC70F
MKDQLFLLKPGFFNAGLGPLYCGDSVSVEGLLSFCPDLRAQVDVHYLAFPRPRTPLVETLGEGLQSVPVIILADETTIADPTIAVEEANGRRYIADQAMIRRYLSTQYDQPLAG